MSTVTVHFLAYTAPVGAKNKIRHNYSKANTAGYTVYSWTEEVPSTANRYLMHKAHPQTIIGYMGELSIRHYQAQSSQEPLIYYRCDHTQTLHHMLVLFGASLITPLTGQWLIKSEALGSQASKPESSSCEGLPFTHEFTDFRGDAQYEERYLPGIVAINDNHYGKFYAGSLHRLVTFPLQPAQHDRQMMDNDATAAIKDEKKALVRQLAELRKELSDTQAAQKVAVDRAWRRQTVVTASYISASHDAREHAIAADYDKLKKECDHLRAKDAAMEQLRKKLDALLV